MAFFLTRHSRRSSWLALGLFSLLVFSGLDLPGLLPASAVQPGPDFRISASPTSLTVLIGASNSSTITLQGSHGFFGILTVTATTEALGLLLAVDPPVVTILTANGRGQTKLTVSATMLAVVGNYTVTVYASNGTITRSISIPVAVRNAPSNFRVAASCTSSTVDAPVSCNATPTGGISPYSYSWSAPGGSPSTGASSSFTTTYPTWGTFTIDLTARDSRGATADDSATVYVSPQPLLLSVSCGTATAGKPVSCTATASGGTTPYSFTWSVSAGNPSTGSGRSFATTFQTKGTYTVSVSITDNNGSTASTQASVIVSPQSLGADFSFAPTNPSSGQTVVFTSSATGGTAPYTSSWSFGDGSSGTGNPSEHSYSASSTFAVTLTLTDANSDSTTATHSITVSVPPSFTADFTFTTANAGQPTTFTATTTGGIAPYTFSWNFGDSTAGSERTTSHTYSSAGTYVVDLTITDTIGARATAAHTIVVPPPPLTADFSPSTASVTQRSSIDFAATYTGGTSPYTFEWNFGDGTTGTGATVRHAYNSTGTFAVVLKAHDANQATAVATHTITVSPPTDTSSPGNTSPNTNPTPNLTSPFNLPLLLLIAANAIMATIAIARIPRLRKKTKQSTP